MKLRNLPVKEKSVRCSFTLKKSDSETLELYAAHVNEKEGLELTTGEVAAAIVTTFLGEDKEFAKWAKDRSEKAPEKPEPTPEQAEEEVDLEDYESGKITGF